MAKGFSVFVNIGGKLNPSLSAAVRAAGAQVKGLGAHVAAVNTRTQATINNFGKGLGNAGKKLQETGRNVTAGLSAPAGLLAFGAGRMAFEFEKAGNLLQALGDASDEQRAKFEGLANTLNKKYPQSLAEIIKTGNEMLKGGFSFDQMTGAIDQTLATAVLGEMSPSEVGNMMARTINSFQMPMKTYDEAMKSSVQVSDRMTYAAVKTTASLRDMGEMYRYVGGAMSASGGTLDQATAFAMAFAKNGTVGSEAGVALRSAVVRMVKMPDKGNAALARIGMNLNNYLGDKKPVTADALLASLQSGGIDATGGKASIEKLLKNKKLAETPAKLTSAITKVVQAYSGGDGALDSKTIADNVNQSLIAAGNNIDLMGFFRDLKGKIDKGQATMGDVATILEGRHFSKYAALFQNDLDGLVSQIQGESNGYTQSRYGTVLKGIVGPVYELDAALEKFSVTLGRIAFPDLAKGFSGLADGIQRMAETQPMLMKFVTYGGLAAIALGPLMMAAGATARGVSLLATGLLTLGRAATVGLATQLVSVAGSVSTLAIATAGGVVGRVRALGAGLVVMSSVGGVSGVLGAIGGSILAFGKNVLMFPVTALRAIGSAMWMLVANPVGATITAIVLALTALGVWVYNNWDGLKSFFSGFAEGLRGALNPTLSGYLDSMVSGFGSLFNWVSQLLGPLQATNAEWSSWGATVGGVVASGINAVASGIARVIGLFSAAIEKAVAFKDTLADAFRAGAGLPSQGDAGRRAAGAAAGAAIGGALQARARGGPVMGGRTYLVGEEGPELFTAPGSGSIVPNDRLRSLSSANRLTVGGGRAPASRGDMSVHFQINGATDPHEVARIAEQKLRELVYHMESDQRANLSD